MARGSSSAHSSQAAAGPSSKRAKRREPTPDEEDEEDNADYTDEEEVATQQQANAGGLTEAEVTRKGAQLAKFALFSEYKRRPLRRTDISSTVQVSGAKAFSAVFASAQATLRNTFGMEFVELYKKPKITAATNGDSQAQTQTQRAGATQKRRRLDDIEEEDESDDEEEEAGPAQTQALAQSQRGREGKGTGMYILRSILPDGIISAMATANPLPMFDDAGNRQDRRRATELFDEEEGDVASGKRDSGALLRWEKGDGAPGGHVALLGLRTLILSLIICVGRVITDDHLHALLKRLNLHRETILPYVSKDAKDPPLTLDKYLDLLARQNYLEKTSTRAPGQEDPSIEWRWGSRDVEFSEKAAAKWIQKVMIDSQEDTFEDEDAPVDPRRRGEARELRTAAKARERLKVDLARAAGSVLK